MANNVAPNIGAVRAPVSVQLEVIVKVNKGKKPEAPDLRHGVKGSVAVKDTNENFAAKSPSANASDLKPASPDLGEPEGQGTHE